MFRFDFRQGQVSSPGAGGVLAMVSVHEAAHAVVGRFSGFQIHLATIAPSRYFGGQVRASEVEPDSPEDIVADASARCAQALDLLPAPGESRDDIGPWLAHVQCRVIELVAGREGERIAGIESNPETAATDFALARIYAATICLSAGAVAAFLDYCKIEARALLRAHWPSLQAVARALEEHQTLGGAEIDAIIFAAEADAAHEAEIRRRDRMVDMAENAQRFQDGQ